MILSFKCFSVNNFSYLFSNDEDDAFQTSSLSMYNQRQALLDVTASADNLGNASGYEQDSYLVRIPSISALKIFSKKPFDHQK